MFPLRPTIVLFGDSITQFASGEAGQVGWGSLLESSYQRRADVLNRGFSGYNTNLAIDLIPRIFGPMPGDKGILFCTIFFGANDAVISGEPQHVPIDQFKQNLKQIAAMIREKTQDDKFPIIFMTPPPLDADAWKANRGRDYYPRTNARTREYGLVVKDVAKDLNCYCLDTWKVLCGDKPVEDYTRYLSDGLHLSESGNRVVYEALMSLLSEQLPDAAPMVDGDGIRGTQGVPIDEELWDVLFNVTLSESKL